MLVSESATVEPVVDQVEGRSGGHDTEGDIVNAKRGHRGFQLFGLEPFFQEFDGGHR